MPSTEGTGPNQFRNQSLFIQIIETPKALVKQLSTRGMTIHAVDKTRSRSFLGVEEGSQREPNA
jgi:hypothetical protein